MARVWVAVVCGRLDGVGHDAVNAALARAEKMIDEQRRRLADADA